MESTIDNQLGGRKMQSCTKRGEFDPLNILASLAFLAFLLQCFASLFDRSRSIIPTIVSSGQFPEASFQEIAEHVIHAMDRYELLNQKSSGKETTENTV